MISRCSGHGGTFGVVKPTHEVAMKVGKTAMRNVVKNANKFLVSDCPLAAKHLRQGAEELAEGVPVPGQSMHPVQIIAMAYGIV